MIQYLLSNFSQPRLEIEIGLQADEWPETIHTAKRENSTCICSSLHVQGTFIYTDSHRCLLHNDNMEHDCTTQNIVSGLIVPGGRRLDTPQAVDWCICTSLHIHGNSVNVRYYHRCPVHNDTLEHDYTPTNIVTGQSNFVRLGELPETINMYQSCICSALYTGIQRKVMQKYCNKCPVHAQ